MGWSRPPPARRWARPPIRADGTPGRNPCQPHCASPPRPARPSVRGPRWFRFPALRGAASATFPPSVRGGPPGRRGSVRAAAPLPQETADGSLEPVRPDVGDVARRRGHVAPARRPALRAGAARHPVRRPGAGRSFPRPGQRRPTRRSTRSSRARCGTPSTDVSPAHDAAAEAAGKARAAFNGNPAVITEAKALLEQRAELEPLTVRQLERVLLNAAEGPMTNPELVAGPHRGRDEAGLDPERLHLHAGRQADHRERDRRPAREAHRPAAAPRGLGGVQADGPGAEARPGQAAGAAQRGGAGAGLPRLLRPAGGGARHDHRGDAEAERGLPARAPAALPAAAHLGEVRTGEEVRPARAEAHPRALDPEPLVAGVERDGGPRRPRCGHREPRSRVGREDRRRLLVGTGHGPAAGVVLEELGPLPGPGR